MAKRKRYRYIWCGDVRLDDPISDFRLISYRAGSGCVRVEIPNDMELCKYSCDSYSTAPYDTTLRELNAQAIVQTSSKWIEVPGLLEREIPANWFKYLPTKEGWIYKNGIYYPPKRFDDPKFMYIYFRDGVMYHYANNPVDSCRYHRLQESIYQYRLISEDDFLNSKEIFAIRVELPQKSKLEKLSAYDTNILNWSPEVDRYGYYIYHKNDAINLFKLSIITKTRDGIIEYGDELDLVLLRYNKMRKELESECS